MAAMLDDTQVLRAAFGEKEKSASTTNSVTRAMALLDCFRPERAALSLTELSAMTGLSKSTALRLLNTLRLGGLVQRTGTTYLLGARIGELAEIGEGTHRRGHDELREVAMPFLQDLFHASGQTIHLGVLIGTDVLYLEKLFGHQRVRTPSRVGMTVPAVCTALGKAMLAQGSDSVMASAVRSLRPMTRYSLRTAPALIRDLHEVRDAGYAFDHQESQLGIACVAAVVPRSDGALAAVSVTGSIDSFDPVQLAATVRRTATNIGRALDAVRPVPSNVPAVI